MKITHDIDVRSIGEGNDYQITMVAHPDCKPVVIFSVKTLSIEFDDYQEAADIATDLLKAVADAKAISEVDGR